MWTIESFLFILFSFICPAERDRQAENENCGCNDKDREWFAPPYFSAVDCGEPLWASKNSLTAAQTKVEVIGHNALAPEFFSKLHAAGRKRPVANCQAANTGEICRHWTYAWLVKSTWT